MIFYFSAVIVYLITLSFTLSLCKAAAYDKKIEEQYYIMSSKRIITINMDASDDEWEKFYKLAEKIVEESSEGEVAIRQFGSIELEHQDQS